MSVVVGVDEVGRGCWAGPMVVGAVILNQPILGLKDSKKLSKKQRELLTELIKVEAKYSLGWVSHSEIDAIGLSAATTLACQRAIENLNADYDEIIIDGGINFLPDNPKATCLIKADDTVPAVSAASIIAKVMRDNFMAEQAVQFPKYGFEKHVGYGTKIHIDALKQFGPTRIHRMSYKPLQVYL